MWVRTIPFFFVLLWSTGFVGAKFGLPFAEPFTLLMWRMALVVPMFALLAVILKRPNLSLHDAAIQGLVGLLIHGIYLGLVFYAINQGVSAGLTALIVSMNPLLIAVFSSAVLNTPVRPKEWFALLLGMLGVIIVLMAPTHWQGAVQLSDIFLLLIALFALCAGTLIQKRYAERIDLITGLSYQYAASLLYFIAMSFTLETQAVQWTSTLIITMAWLIIALSLASVLLLMYLIQQGDATRVASYFYLVPPMAAFWGWLFFDEQWSWTMLVGITLVVTALAMNRVKP
ncbi:MAG: DMT family transporter [Arenicellales bacterium]